MVAEWIVDAPDAAVELTLVDLADLDLPLVEEPTPPAFGDYQHATTRAWSRLAATFDAFVLVTPEYNHSTSAALKNALDHLYAEWQDKPVAFVGYGLEGGTRAVEHLRTICAELGMAGVGPQVALRLRDDFVEGRCAPPPAQVDARARMLDALARWAGELRPLRVDVQATDDGRRILDQPRWQRAARQAADALIADLQAGMDRADADRYDRRFAHDVLWGQPLRRHPRRHR